MQRMDLGGIWDLRYCDPGEGERLGWPEGARDKEFVAAGCRATYTWTWRKPG